MTALVRACPSGRAEPSRSETPGGLGPCWILAFDGETATFEKDLRGFWYIRGILSEKTHLLDVWRCVPSDQEEWPQKQDFDTEPTRLSQLAPGSLSQFTSRQLGIAWKRVDKDVAECPEENATRRRMLCLQRDRLRQERERRMNPVLEGIRDKITKSVCYAVKNHRGQDASAGGTPEEVYSRRHHLLSA